MPEDRFVLSINWQADRLRLGFDVVALFNTHSDSAGVLVVLDDHFVVNQNVSLRVSDMFTLKGRIENFFDVDYELVYGYPMPGLTFRFSLEAIM